MTRIVIHILIPLNLVISIALVGGGVIQNLKPAEKVSLLEPIAVSAETVALDADGKIIENAVIDTENATVTVNGKAVEDATIIAEGDIVGSVTDKTNAFRSEVLTAASINKDRTAVSFGEDSIKVNMVTEEFVPMGPAASQVAIKQTGTNGGGFMGVNSAHPLRKFRMHSPICLEMISLLLIPAALCFTFGKAVKNKKQGVAIFMAMFIMPGGGAGHRGLSANRWQLRSLRRTAL